MTRQTQSPADLVSKFLSSISDSLFFSFCPGLFSFSLLCYRNSFLLYSFHLSSFKFSFSFAVGPTEVRILNRRDPLSAGKRYEVKCRTVGARPQPMITWWIGGKNVRIISYFILDLLMERDSFSSTQPGL